MNYVENIFHYNLFQTFHNFKDVTKTSQNSSAEGNEKSQEFVPVNGH